MELTIVLILLIVLAGFIKGFVGFGLSLILITVLLEAGFKPTELLPILVPLFIILDLLLFWENRKYFKLDFKENFTLHPTTLMTIFLGILLGTYLLKVIETDILKLIFAITILILIIFLVGKVNMHQMRIPSERSNGVFGAVSGVLTGLFTINAIPVSLYLLFYQYPKEKYMGALVTFLMITDLLLVAVYLFGDLFTLEGFLVSFQLIFITLAGFLGGSWVRRRINTSKFKVIVILILMLNSIKIIYDYFFF